MTAALPLPMRCDTTDRANAIEAVVGEKSSGVRCPIDRLLAVLVA